VDFSVFNHLPFSEIAIGKILYLLLSKASYIERAERIETSCSADLPPNIKAIFILEFDTLIILSDNSTIRKILKAIITGFIELLFSKYNTIFYSEK
jgi:hypothetical protein